MGDTKAIGVAYRDQDLNGSTLTNCGINGGTIAASTLSTGNFTATGNVALGNQTSDTVAFYGATPQTQATSSNEAAAATTAPVSVSATQWAFSTSTQPLTLLLLVAEMRTVLVNLGLMKGS